MGNQLQAVPNKLKMAYNPVMEDWVVIQKSDKVKVWQNKRTMELIEQYQYMATDKAQLYKLRSHFEHRFNKPYIVASRFFKQRQTDQLCSSFYETSMFIEHIGLRLNQFRDVIFPDCLHLYYACLHGFGELQARLGFFDVSDSLVGINQLGQVKVWANVDFSKQRPKITSSKEGEIQMLANVIDLVHKSVDTQTQPQSISSYLLQNTKSFQQAVAALRQFAAKHQVQIPKCLQTVNHLRERGALDAGPFIRPDVTQKIEPSHIKIAPQVHVQDSKHPISLLQAEALKYQLSIQPPSAVLVQPQIAPVMYQPIGWNIASSPYQNQNIPVNTMKNSEQFSSILPNKQNSKNIKQSQIVSQMIAISPQQDPAKIQTFVPKFPVQNRPIYLSTSAFIQRQGGTAGNIANLNKKYFNIASHLTPSLNANPKHPSLIPRLTQTHQSQISNIPKITPKRNPPIFSSLQGSNRQLSNLKGSQQYNQPQFFNNTIIYSIENQVRRDQDQAALRLEAKRNKLSFQNSIQLSIQNGNIRDSIKQSSQQLKQSTIQAFSISINNIKAQQQFEERTKNQTEDRLDEEKKYQQYTIDNKKEQVIQNEQPIRFSQLQSTQVKQKHGQSPQRYSYVPNYSFDKNYQLPEITPPSVPDYQKPTQQFPSEKQELPVSSSNIVLKATIKNPHKIDSSLKLIAPSSASELITSIQQIRNSQRQLREQLKQYI